MLREDVTKVRADLRKRLGLRTDATPFLPAGGPNEAETSGWTRVVERLASNLRREETHLRECADRLRSLRASNLTRSVLLERAVVEERSAAPTPDSQTPATVAPPHANGSTKKQTPSAPTSRTRISRPVDRPLTSTEAVLAALRSAGPSGATSQEILAYLQAIDHPIIRRSEPIQSVHTEIYGIRKRDPNLVRVARTGREARYALGRSDTPSIAGINTAPSRSSVASKQPSVARGNGKASSAAKASNEEAILSALRSFGSSGAKLNDIIAVLKRTRHPLVKVAEPRNAVYYQVSRIRDRRPRVIVCRKDGREVIYRMR